MHHAVQHQRNSPNAFVYSINHMQQVRLKASTVYILETENSQSEGFVSYFSSINENKQKPRANRGRTESAWRTSLPRAVKHLKIQILHIFTCLGPLLAVSLKYIQIQWALRKYLHFYKAVIKQNNASHSNSANLLSQTLIC